MLPVISKTPDTEDRMAALIAHFTFRNREIKRRARLKTLILIFFAMGKMELFTGGAKTTQQQSACTPCHHLIRGPLIHWDTTDTLSREERLKRLKMRIERSTAIVSRSKVFCVHKTRKLVELFRVQQPWQDVTIWRAVVEAVLVVGSLSFVPTLWFLIYTYWPDQEDYLRWHQRYFYI